MGAWGMGHGSMEHGAWGMGHGPFTKHAPSPMDHVPPMEPSGAQAPTHPHSRIDSSHIDFQAIRPMWVLLFCIFVFVPPLALALYVKARYGRFRLTDYYGMAAWIFDHPAIMAAWTGLWWWGLACALVLSPLLVRSYLASL